jgi:hypothetical protein
MFHAKFVAEDEIHPLFRIHSFCKPVGFELIKKKNCCAVGILMFPSLSI